MFTLPTVITFARIFAIPVLLLIIYGPFEMVEPTKNILATIVFVIASLTDWLDGWLARRLNQISSFGAFLDPVADKIIVTVALLLMIHDGKIDGFHFYAAVIIIAREVLVSGLREYLAKLQVSLPVTQLSKVKTFIQMFSISVLLSGEPGNLFLLGYGTMIGILGLWISTIISVQTGYVYTVKCLKHT